jgi:micrococcal nuclease
MYEYKAIITSVYDGDTITADIDLGFGIWAKNQKIRMYKINAPEIRGASREQGLISRDYLRSLILGKEVILKTYKDSKEKYGRWLGWLVSLNGINVNDNMLATLHAVPYMEDNSPEPLT